MFKNVLVWVLMLSTSVLMAEEKYQPYVLAYETGQSLEEASSDVLKSLEAQNFKLVGIYKSSSFTDRMVIIVTHDQLVKAVQKVGGLTGFAATLRVGLVKENGKVSVTYSNPDYWYRAYYTSHFDKVKPEINVVTKALENSFKGQSNYLNKPYGSKKGMDADDLEDYNYMMGMPKFDDTKKIGKYGSYAEAKAAVEKNLKSNSYNAKFAYRYEVPGKNLTVYGFGFDGEKGEKKFIPVIDMATPKHVAFLPYELLVVDNEIHMLHGRYRIALSFPDLTMGTFTKIMSTPGDIEDMFKELVQ